MQKEREQGVNLTFRWVTKFLPVVEEDVGPDVIVESDLVDHRLKELPAPELLPIMEVLASS